MSASHAFQYDSDQEEDEPQYIFDGKDINVFVIDCNQKMFDELVDEDAVDQETNSAFDLCLNSIEELFLKKLRKGSSNEMVSILLYNTEKTDTKDCVITPDNCAILFSLQRVDVDIVRYIKNTRESDDYNDFPNKYGHSSAAKISDVLWLCKSVSSEVKVNSLTIYWFTNTSMPHDRNSPLFKEAMAKAEEFQYLQPDFQLIQLNVEFKFNQFYKHFIAQLTGKDEDEIIEPPIELIPSCNEAVEKIVKRLSRVDYRNRALANITWEISDTFKFGVTVHNFTRKKSEPKPIRLDRVTKQPIESKRAYKYGTVPEGDNSDGDLDRSVVLNERLTADKTVKYIEVGGEKVKFTPLEVYESKQVMQPKIKLIGFKPNSTFNYHHSKNAYFIYPSEKNIKGSTAAFRGLWESCLNLEKYAICIFTMRLKSFSRFVALVPQLENPKLNTFDGFRMEFLPYGSDVRDLDSLHCKYEKNDDALIDAVSDLIKKLKVAYDPSMINNPCIDKIYNKIESTVFCEDRKPIDDISIPKLEQQDARAGSIVETIKEMIGGFDEEAVKRKATDTPGGTRAKKSKEVIDIDSDMILQKCQAGETKNITVAVLKDYLRVKNATGISKLTKDELIAKIVEIS